MKRKRTRKFEGGFFQQFWSTHTWEAALANKRLHTVYIPWLNTSDVRMRNWVTGSLVSTVCQANNRIGVHCPRLRSKLLCLAASVARFPPRVESSVTDSSRVRKWGMYWKTKSPPHRGGSLMVWAFRYTSDGLMSLYIPFSLFVGLHFCQSEEFHSSGVYWIH